MLLLQHQVYPALHPCVEQVDHDLVIVLLRLDSRQLLLRGVLRTIGYHGLGLLSLAVLLLLVIFAVAYKIALLLPPLLRSGEADAVEGARWALLGHRLQGQIVVDCALLLHLPEAVLVLLDRHEDLVDVVQEDDLLEVAHRHGQVGRLSEDLAPFRLSDEEAVQGLALV